LGDTSSMLSLAAMYAGGQGVEKDERMSLEWIRRAAAGGNEQAKEILKKRKDR